MPDTDKAAPQGAGAPDWAAIRIAYERGPDSVTQLCGDHRVTRSQLYARIDRHGWLRRRVPAPDKAAPRIRRGEGTHAALIGRLYRRFARHMSVLEERIDKAGLAPAAPGDDEREARTLALLARTLEKLIDIESGIAARRGKAHADKRNDGRDGERLVAELSRRLRQMAASDPGAAGGPAPGDAEPDSP